VKRAVVLVAAAAVLAGCGGQTSQSRQTAGAFIAGIVREDAYGRWAEEWSALHPGHQRLISRAQYVACSRTIGAVAQGRVKVRVLQTVRVPIHVRDVPQHEAIAVTVSLTHDGSVAPTIIRLHAVRVGDRWRWILSDRFLSAIARGRCLNGSPLSRTTP
jgi:hypothetical protein